MTKANDPKPPGAKPSKAKKPAAAKLPGAKATGANATGAKPPAIKPSEVKASAAKAAGSRTPGAKSHGDVEIAEAVLELVAARGADKTVCPSEVARHLAGSNPDAWSPLMQPIRRVAVRLTKEGRIALLRKGKPVDDPDDFRGIYRLGQPIAEA